ncbi:InlB B-repeat-containing protein, partial [Aminicella lysinilytica]|uniref:InlB B-repeat-containing protein n=1 Tax=Aminicella lysinilytica TaxID=433323 RepID=UPI001414EDBC
MRKKLMAILLSVAVISMYTFGSVGSIFAEDASTDTSTQTESTQTTDTTEATDSTSTGTEDTTAESEDSTQDTTVSYPEQSFSDSVGGTDISVSAPEGAFPEGTTMKATAVSSSDVQTAIDKAAGSEVKNLQAIDITFYDKDGNKVEPKKNVDVKFSSVDLNGDNGLNVYHMNSDNTSADKVAESDSSDSASLSTGSFSIYVITDGDPVLKTYKFYNESGDKVVSEQTVKTGDKLVEPETPTKEGHKFLGWATKGSTDYFTSFGTQTVGDTAEVDLYPQFQQAYYVYFMDGTSDDSRVIFTKEGVANEEISTNGVMVPLASNMSVTGWYTDAGLTNKVSSVTLKDSNVKLYPKVEEGNYLTFDANGGSYTEPEFVSKSGVTAAPTTPIKAGYTFKYWADKDGNEYTFGHGILADVTLYAVWEASQTTYTVIHWQQNANDDEYSYKESETMNGTADEKTAAVANKYDGFKTVNTITQQTINGDGSTIVNVYYDREMYTIHFYNRVEKWYPFEGSYYVKGSELTDLKITAKYGENIKDKWPTSTATNWLVEPNGNTYQSGISTMPLGGANFYYVDQNGKYTIKTYYYTETLDGKTYELDHTDSFKSSHTNWHTTKEDHYDIDGFTYTKNIDDNSYYHQEGNSKTYSVTFNYSRNSYNVKFINKGSVDKTETNKYQADISGLSYTPERPSNVPEGYTFAGWYDNENCEGEAYSFTGKTMPSHNITLYAKWAAPTYTAKAHLDLVDSGSTESKSLTVGYGSKINKSDMPTVVDSTGKVLSQGDDEKKVTVPDGYKWLGWSTYSNGEYKLYNFDTEVYADKDLYPNYISEAKYKVSYDLNSDSASGTVPTDLMNYASGSYAEVASGLTIIAPTGKVFLNWNTSKDGTGDTYYPKDKIQIKGDTTLYAQYGPIESVISLTYHANYPDGIKASGSTENTVNSLKNNEKVALLENTFTEATSDYVFEGWNTRADGSGTTYATGSEVYIDNDTTQGTNDLYAKWVKKEVLNVEITGNTDSVVYDGQSHSVEGYTINANDLPEGVSVSLNAGSKAIATGTNAGIYNMGLTKDDFTISGADKYKVNLSVNDGSLTIAKAAVTLTSASDSKEFDGDPLTNDKVTSEGFVGNDGATYDVTGTQTYVGESKNAFSYTLNGDTKADNYDITKTEGTLKVTDRKEAYDITVKAKSDSATYDGKEHSVSGFDATEFTVEEHKYTVEGLSASAKGTNAGTYASKVEGTAKVLDAAG